jgi:hypothetical protein
MSIPLYVSHGDDGWRFSESIENRSIIGAIRTQSQLMRLMTQRIFSVML